MLKKYELLNWNHTGIHVYCFICGPCYNYGFSVRMPLEWGQYQSYVTEAII